MFAQFHRSLSKLSKRDRAVQGARFCRVQSPVEQLESRCMLSFAPSDAGYYVENDDLQSAIWSNVEEVAGAIVQIGLDAGTIRDRISGVVLPILSRGDDSLFVDHLKSGLIADLIGSSSPERSWADEVETSFEQEPDFTSEIPDDGEPSGFVDIGPPDTLPVDGLYVGEAEDHETQQVHEMLSSLSYLPAGWDQEPAGATSGSTIADAASVTSGKLTAEVTTLTTPQRERVEILANDPLQPSELSLVPEKKDRQSDSSEGGLIPLQRGLLQDNSTTEAHGKSSLLQTPVEMDKTQGKFQAFEVSTTEALPAPAAPSSSDGARLDQLLLLIEQTELVPTSDAVAIDGIGIAAGELQAAGDTESEEDQEPAVAATSPVQPLGAAVATAAVVAGHIVWTTYIRKPDDRRQPPERSLT